MKSFICAAAAIALVAISSVDATSESNVHVRVHAASSPEGSPVGEWGQCKEDGKAPKSCVSGTTCRVSSQYYGQCLKEPAQKWGQCGGKGWTGTCVSGTSCKYSNEWYSQCI